MPTSTGRVDPAGRVQTHCRFTSSLIADGLTRLGIQAEIRVVPHWHLAHRYVLLPELGVGLTHSDDLYDRTLAGVPTGQLLLDVGEIEQYWQSVIDAYLQTESSTAERLQSDDEGGTAAPAPEGMIEVATQASPDADPEWHTVPLSEVVERMPPGLRAELPTPDRMARAIERCRPVIAKMGRLIPERSKVTFGAEHAPPDRGAAIDMAITAIVRELARSAAYRSAQAADEHFVHPALR